MTSPMPDGDDWGRVEIPDNWIELGDAEKEMGRQDEQWGEQNHPDIFERERAELFEEFAFEADWWKKANAARVEKGTLSWDGILLEEVYEALGEPDETKMRVELIQVAAVALQWAGAIRRRQKNR